MTLGGLKSRVNRLEKVLGTDEPAAVLLHETTTPERYPNGITVAPGESTSDVLTRLGYDPARTIAFRLNFGD